MLVHTEPVVFFGVGVASFTVSTVYQLNYNYFAELNNFNTSTKEKGYDCLDKEISSEQKATQNDVSAWSTKCQTVFMFACLLGFFLSALSDVYGRRSILLVTVFGQVLYTLLHSMQFFFDWPLELQYVANVINGLTGATTVLISVSVSGIADLSIFTGKSIKLRMLIYEFCLGLGEFVVYFSMGIVIDHFRASEYSGLLHALVLAMIVQVLLMVYIFIFVTDKYQDFTLH